MNSLTISSLTQVATTVCKNTFGCSDNVMKVYEKEQNLLSKPLTPDNVNKLIKCENRAAIYGSGKSVQDRMAITFVPVRYFLAHSAAYLLVTSHEGFCSDNDYSKESFLRLMEIF